MTELRQQLIDSARRMSVLGLNRGTAGNVSVRAGDESDEACSAFLITPTGMAYDTLEPEDIVRMRLDGTCTGRRKPSSEWRFHRDLYVARADAGAILHAHSPFATSLACLRRDIPPFHYMIARFGGDRVRCAGYATFGTQALSDRILRAIDKRRACLLANHGMLARGSTLLAAFETALKLETLARQYLLAKSLGTPTLLTPEEWVVVQQQYKTYGKAQALDRTPRWQLP